MNAFCMGLWLMIFGAGEASSSQADRDLIERTSVELPFALPWEPSERGYTHILLYDATGEDTWFSPLWERQAQVLRNRLQGLGVPRERIQIHPIHSQEDFQSAVRSGQGRKKIYAFGHGNPLVMYFGKESVSIIENAKSLQEEGVDFITHYGCSFTNLSVENIKPLQERLNPDTRITFYGHRLPSNTEDDSPWNKGNPIVRLVVSKNRASLHLAQDDLASRVNVIPSLFSASFLGPVPTTLAAVTPIYAADHVGRKPERLPDPPSPFSFLWSNLFRSIVPPAPPSPQDRRPGAGKSLPPRTWLDGARDAIRKILP